MILWIFFLAFGCLFGISFAKERRLFRNAVYFAFSLLFLLEAISYSARESALGLFILLFLFVLLPLSIFLVSFVFIAAGITSIRKEGFSAAHILSIAFGIGVWGFFLAAWFMFTGHIPTVIREILVLIVMAAIYILFTFAALFLYSLFYQIVPKNRSCDFVIVHGAGLLEGRRVSPLLARRLEKGIQIYKLSGKKAKIIVSGGQGKDETISEAQAMKDYLLSHAIPTESIILENQSKTTMENLRFSKKIMDGLMKSYRCIFVTNDYHVFRAGTYARKIGLKADGIGCKTAFYYWPNAFIREYIAIMIRHKAAPILLVTLWAVGVIIWNLVF